MTDNELIERFWIEQGGKPNLAPDIWFYENDWNMIMPVVGKVVLYCDNIIGLSTEWHTQYIRPLNLALMRVDFKAVYAAVVQFIKWYNQTKKS